MTTNRRTAGPGSRLRTTGGYSLVEMLAAIGVSLVVGLAIFAIFGAMQRGQQAQKILNDTQTSCNFAMDQMKNELIRAGYRIPKYRILPSTDPVCTGNPSDSRCQEIVRPIRNAVQNGYPITFEYYDDNARTEAGYTSGKTNATQVTYTLNVDSQLVREFRRFDGATYPAPTTASDIASTTQVLASNITALSFKYFTSNGDEWTSGEPTDIRTISPTLTCRSSQKDPNLVRTLGRSLPPEDPKLYRHVTLTSEVRARNVGVDSVSVDVTPPVTPTGLVSWDPGQCGTLNLRWNANTEVDLNGYILFYGPTSTDFTNRLTVGRSPGTAGSFEFQTVVNQESLTLDSEFYFAIEAYDKSGNISALSPVTHGNPNPSVRSVNPGSSDSTVNTLGPPAAPTDFTATAGVNSVTLTWTRSPVVGLTGYKLFRSTTGPDFTIIDDIPVAGGNRIKDYMELGPATTSFLDTGLLGCTNYYYKLVAIDCVTTISAAAMLAASATGAPTDNVNPSTPSLIAKPGYRRIILTLTNPVKTGINEDFAYTRIWYSTAAHPTFDPDTKVVSGGLPIPDSNPYPPTYGAGSYTGTGTITPTPNFNSLTDGSPGYTVPALPACTNQAAIDAAIAATGPVPDCDPITYFFTAVAFDQCLNASLVTAASQSQGTQCGDCTFPDLCYNAPPAPTTLTPGGCSSVDGLRVTWNELDTNIYRDLAGYHIWRCEGTTCASGGTELTGGTPAWTNEFINTDTGTFPVVDGTVYSYRIEAADCYYERRATVSAAERAANNPDDNSNSTSINNLSGGKVLVDPIMSRPVTGYLLPESAAKRAALPGSLPWIATHFTISAADDLTSVPPTFQHNAVTAWVRNTAGSDLTLTRVQLSWENQQAYLQQVAFGDGLNTPMTRLGWRDTSTTLTTTSPGTVDLAANSRLWALDDKIPFVTQFRKADLSIDGDVDARQQSLTYKFTYRNESTATEDCSVAATSLYAPLGPYIYGTSQDQPADGTRAWAVPGDDGTNDADTIGAPAGSAVSVFANIFDSSGATIVAGAVKLYYTVTGALTAAPDLASTAEYPNLAPYTAIDMVKISGSQWRTPVGGGIPSNPGKSIWYFIVAVDDKGNFDRAPEFDSGAFQYYQQQANVCATIPNPPTALSGTTGSDQVTLVWSAPLENTDASDYLDGKGYKVYRRQDAGAWLYLATINDKTAGTFTDFVGSSIDSSVYDYRVAAFDMCTPTAKESAPSNTYTETAEGPCGNTPSAPVLSGATGGTGGSVTLSWTEPTTNSSGTTLIDLVGYQVWKRIDNGAWAMIATTPAGTETYHDDGLVDTGYRDHSYFVKAYDSCSDPSANLSDPSNLYVDGFTANACDTTPGAVSNIHFTMVNSTTGVDLDWDAPTTQITPAGWPYNDPGGYEIWRRKMNADGITFAGEAGVVHTIVGTDTFWRDSSVSAYVGTFVYDYWVRAFDTCSSPKYGSWIGPVRETYEYVEPCDAAPNAPTGLVVTAADSSGVKLSWSAPNPLPSDFAGYVIERKNGATGVWTPIVSTVPAGGSPLYGGATSIKDLVFDAGKYPYFYRVQTIDTCGTGPGSTYIEAQETYDYCTSLLPDGPTILTASASSNTAVDLSWTAPATVPDDFAGYIIERKKDAGAWGAISGSPLWGAATTFTDASMTDAGAAIYSYRVKAFDLCAAVPPNYSPLSNEASEVYTDPCAGIPDVPTSPALAISSVTPVKCDSGGDNQKVTILWTGPAPTSTLFYRILKCSTSNTDSAADCTPASITPASEPPGSTQSSTLKFDEPKAGLRPDAYRLWYWVEYVSHSSSCGSGSWKTLRSSPVKDSCGP